VEIWFNPKCSKCQAVVDAVEETGQAYTLRAYLDVPPTYAELDDLLTKLGQEPWEICRMNEPVAAELGLATMEKDRAAWIEAMIRHPVLIQRPIVVRSDGRAVVARSEETLREAVRR
jgi:arsenate reductase